MANLASSARTAPTGRCNSFQLLRTVTVKDLAEIFLSVSATRPMVSHRAAGF
jgi:hypothetical protein